jgi:hypothetical protein
LLHWVTLDNVVTEDYMITHTQDNMANMGYTELYGAGIHRPAWASPDHVGYVYREYRSHWAVWDKRHC